jgi:hypothetical protein
LHDLSGGYRAAVLWLHWTRADCGGIDHDPGQDLVIAIQRVGATRRPMTGSAKQSIVPQAETRIASSLRSSQ